MVTLEQFLSKIADTLIQNIDDFTDGTPEENKAFLQQHQKTVRNGIIQRFRTDDERMIIYQRNAKANREDFNINETYSTEGGEASYNSLTDFYESVVASASSIDQVNVSFQLNDNIVGMNVQIEGSGNIFDIGPYIFPNADGNNSLNISQYMQFQNQSPSYDINAIKEFFDIRIHELLPQQRTRQQRINDFFNEYQLLKGSYPQFADYSDPEDFLIEPEEGYSAGHDISYVQDNPGESTIEEENSSITRLSIGVNSRNRDKTLEYLRDDLNRFLEDIDQDNRATLRDERPDYENKSEGYLKIRNLNQGIIVRKQEGDNIGIEDQKFVPTEPNPVNNLYYHPYYKLEDSEEAQRPICTVADCAAPTYLVDGFTITMWVKFLDRTTRGTLFNYGNPLRGYDPKGFVLETFVLGKDEKLSSTNALREDGYETWGDVAIGMGNEDLFKNQDYERFIRLVVRDHIDKGINGEWPLGKTYDSHLGINGFPRYLSVPDFGYDDHDDPSSNPPEGVKHKEGDEKFLLTHTRVPIDFEEWYFIVATYNPMMEDDSATSANYLQDPDFWRGNITDPTGANPEYTDDSGVGAKCKVEIISKSDLLRARGYAPEE